MANDSVDLPSYSQIDDKRRSISRPAQSLYLHYKLFHSGIPLTVRECFDYEERGIGRIKRTDISPPYTMQFVKKTICEVEGFEMSDIKAVHMDGESEPTGDDVPVSFQLGSPGTSLDSPIAIVLEEAAKVADPAVQRGRYLAKAPHEDVLFQASNGKFFAHIDGEWTEHQLGEFQILHNRITGQPRLLVRHQHTQAFLTGQRSLDGWELSPSKSSERTWSWRELAEPDGSKYKKHRHWVSVRFEHKREAKAFKETIESARAGKPPVDIPKTAPDLSDKDAPLMSPRASMMVPQSPSTSSEKRGISSFLCLHF